MRFQNHLKDHLKILFKISNESFDYHCVEQNQLLHLPVVSQSEPDDQLFHRLTCHFLSGSVPGMWNSFEQGRENNLSELPFPHAKDGLRNCY